MKNIIVIPCYNEASRLPKDKFIAYSEENPDIKFLFVNDGSKDNTLNILRTLCKKHSEIRVVDLNGNFGQHMAIMAGFGQVQGNKIITLDADLQNPPEEIPKIIAEMDKGHDVVGSYRINRQDPIFRKIASKIVNKITNKRTTVSNSKSDFPAQLRKWPK